MEMIEHECIKCDYHKICINKNKNYHKFTRVGKDRCNYFDIEKQKITCDIDGHSIANVKKEKCKNIVLNIEKIKNLQ